MPDPQPSTFKVNGDSYPIDRYAPPGPGRFPVVVILHGVDGMVSESETEIRKLAVQIANDGFAVFLPHYFGADRPGAGLPSEEVLVQRTLVVNSFRPRVTAAVQHATADPASDAARLGVVGLSLGGGLALWFAETAPRGSVRAVVDFFGYIADPAIYANVTALPPTLVFHNKADGFVPSQLSVNLLAALERASIVHDGTVYTTEPPYPQRKDHTFRPGGAADIDSRTRTRQWLAKYVIP
jgi:dienelactone hydrolase